MPSRRSSTGRAATTFLEAAGDVHDLSGRLARADRHLSSYVLVVSDERAEALTSRDSLRYTSPPQSEQQARRLDELLAGSTVTGDGPWRHPTAGGQRTIQLRPSV